MNQRGSICLIILLAVLALCFAGCIGFQSSVLSGGQTLSFESGSSDMEIEAEAGHTLDVAANVDVMAEKGDGTLGLKVNGAKKVINKGTHANINKNGSGSYDATFRGGYSKSDNGTADHYSESAINAGGGWLHDLIYQRGVKAERANVPALPVRDESKTGDPGAPVPAD